MRVVKTAIGGLAAACRVALTGTCLPALLDKIGSAPALDLEPELQRYTNPNHASGASTMTNHLVFGANQLGPYRAGQASAPLVLRRPGQQGDAQGSNRTAGALKGLPRNHGAPAAHARDFGTTPPAPGQRPPRANLSVQSTTPAFIDGRRASFTIVFDKEGTGCLVARPAVAFADLHRPPRA